MNIIDYSTIFLIFISAIFGLYRGFIVSVVSLTGWVIAICLTYHFFPGVEKYLAAYIKYTVIVILLSSAGLLIFFLAIIGLINSLIYKLMSSWKHGFTDKFTGFLFGAFRGVLICFFLFFCFSITLKTLSGKKSSLVLDDYPDILMKSASFDFLDKGTKLFSAMLPSSFSQRVSNIYDNISEKDVDIRFVERMIIKLSDFLSEDEIRRVNLMRQDMIVTDSNEIIDIKTAKELLTIYRKKIHEGKIKENFLQKEDITRLKRIIKDALED